MAQVVDNGLGNQTSYEEAVQPFLAKHCFTCHSEKLKTANLNLEAFKNGSLAAKSPEVWDRVREKLSTGKMPPPGLPAPANAEQRAVTDWIDSMLSRYAMGNGFAGIAIDAANLTTASRATILDQALTQLRAARSVVLYSALGSEGVTDAVRRDQLAGEMGLLLPDLLHHSGVKRAVVAGGDTASHAGRQLGVHALTLAAPLAPGSPLCKAHSDSPGLDGVELVFKGGQVGQDNFFESALGGHS